MPGGPSRVAVFLHSGDYDRMHQGLSIAATAAAAGRPVEVFLFWWALGRFVRGELDEPDFGEGPFQQQAADDFERLGAPTLRQLLEHLRESKGARLYACTASLAFVGAKPAEMEPKVDGLVGWSAILRMTEGVVDRFYL